MRRLLLVCLSGMILIPVMLDVRPAIAETLMEKAELWGRMHGHSIHCRMANSHEFGIRAVRYFRRQASGETFERLRDAYGLKILDTAHSTPPRSLGGDCGRFRVRFMEVYEELG